MANEQSSGLFQHNICFEIDPFLLLRSSFADTEDRERFAKSYLRQFSQDSKVFLSLLVYLLLVIKVLWTVECVEAPIMFSFNYHFLSSFASRFVNLSRSDLPDRIGSLRREEKSLIIYLKHSLFLLSCCRVEKQNIASWFDLFPNLIHFHLYRRRLFNGSVFLFST